MLYRRVFLALLVCLTACGELALDTEAASLCGESSCSSNSYCADDVFGTCLPGCRRDTDCAPGLICGLPFGEVIGECAASEEDTAITEAGPETDSCLEACENYYFFQCIDQEENQECLQWCVAASPEAAEEFASCESASSCNIDACFGR